MRRVSEVLGVDDPAWVRRSKQTMDSFRSLTSVHRPSFTSHSPHPHRRAAQFQYHNTLSGSARAIMINWISPQLVNSLSDRDGFELPQCLCNESACTHAPELAPDDAHRERQTRFRARLRCGVAKRIPSPASILHNSMLVDVPERTGSSGTHVFVYSNPYD